MTVTLADRIRRWTTPERSHADEALEAAVDEHWASVCDTLFYLVGDWDQAQDLALETFWRLHTRPPKTTSDPSELGGWLYRVATNLGLNAIRARRRRRKYEEAAGTARLERDAPVDPADEVERRQVQEQVRHVLSHMPPRKAQILVLRYTDHSYAEIADLLGVAVGSVGTMLARAEKDFERRYRPLEDVR